MNTIGSLFSGYGGLDIAVQSVLGGSLAWYSEIDQAACKVLAAHHPGTRNLGDITAVEWAGIQHVDILTGGYPCQPFSHAGQRKGSNDDRHLWPYVRSAIDALRPGLVVLENVRGHLTLGLADVLGELAGMGYDARWGVVRASETGAPHSRARVFIIANPSRGTGRAGTGRRVPEPSWTARSAARHRIAPPDTDRRPLERAATAWDRLPVIAERGDLAPTDSHWGKYEPAIRRWEHVLGRPAPAPTVTGTNGRPRLSPLLVEWMMGLDEGWVTGHGLSASQQLKMLGNGVCPQQAQMALRMLL